MANGIESLLGGYYNNYALNYSGSSAKTPGIFDVGAAQKAAAQQASEMMAAYKSNSAEVKTLKADTAKYLDQYTLSLKTLDQSANKLRGQNLDKLLFDKDGQVTDATVQNTVKAAQTFVDNYNSTLKLLNDNAGRGDGTMKQLARMADDPAPAASMKMVGVTVNKDGTLALDASKMTEALKTTNSGNFKLFKDIIGGYGGIADNVHKEVMQGQNIPARELVNSDLASIQSTMAQNPFKQMRAELGGNVYALNNMAVTGMLMNMLV